jgi:glucose-1-phosphate cytidylyltransferase
MKVILLAGGLGTRISEETDTKPKPMVLLDDKPIIWHIMSVYAAQGFDEFIIATGYKGHVINDWVLGLNTSWKVQTLDTGLESQTGGRIRRCMESLPDQRVMITYGDGLGNVNLRKLVDFHDHHGKPATVTAVRPPARFGVLETSNGLVKNFGEKNQADAGWINGGFFILESNIREYIKDDAEPFEAIVMPRIVADENLMAFHHEGFWQPMDTLREKNELSELAKLDRPPWVKIY